MDYIAHLDGKLFLAGTKLTDDPEYAQLFPSIREAEIACKKTKDSLYTTASLHICPADNFVQFD